MNSDDRIEPNPDVVARQLAPPEGAVLLHLETGAYHGLNQVGYLVWNAIDGTRTVGEIVELVRTQVLDPPAELDDEVRQFLEGARDRGLLRVRSS